MSRPPTCRPTRKPPSRTLQQVAQAHVPLEGAENARIVAFRPSDGGKEHLAIVVGEIDPTEPVLIRLHSECFTGDLLGSLRCDCGEQLRGAIAEIAKQGSGVLLYLAQEGRGIGLVNKLRAYELQDDGFDTIDANEQLGFDADERIYVPAATMLARMGIQRVRLLTNNPEKIAQLERYGIEVAERVAALLPVQRPQRELPAHQGRTSRPPALITTTGGNNDQDASPRFRGWQCCVRVLPLHRRCPEEVRPGRDRQGDQARPHQSL